MRWCKNCGKVNSGWPVRCRYCSVGLDGRLCARNHVNPVDPSLAFCGECGGPLDRKHGAGFSVQPYLTALSVLLAAGILATLPLLFLRESPMTSVFVALLILVLGLRLALQILPPSARNLIAAVCRGTGNLLVIVLFGTGNKGRK
jgi:hypothetical protein